MNHKKVYKCKSERTNSHVDSCWVYKKIPVRKFSLAHGVGRFVSHSTLCTVCAVQYTTVLYVQSALHTTIRGFLRIGHHIFKCTLYIMNCTPCTLWTLHSLQSALFTFYRMHVKPYRAFAPYTVHHTQFAAGARLVVMFYINTGWRADRLRLRSSSITY